jgi:hypothetical protein
VKDDIARTAAAELLTLEEAAAALRTLWPRCGTGGTSASGRTASASATASSTGVKT